MSILRFLGNVVVPKTVIIAAALINAANELDLTMPMFITSGNDSVHMKGSKHYTDEALDFRTHHLTDDIRTALQTTVARRLGRDYQVIMEDAGTSNAHLHIEFDKV